MTRTTIKTQTQMTKTQIHYQKLIKYREKTIAAAAEGADDAKTTVPSNHSKPESFDIMKIKDFDR